MTEAGKELLRSKGKRTWSYPLDDGAADFIQSKLICPKKGSKEK